MSSEPQQNTGPQRETMECDVVIVGGGVAGLSAAYHLQNEAQKAGLNELMIVVLEKGREIGAHSLSGAVLNPRALREMIPNYKELGCPIESEVHEDAVYFLSSTAAIPFPVVPPPFRNEGNYIVSLSQFNRWLGGLCEQKGINVFPGFAAVEALFEGDKIVGIRTGDKGVNKKGEAKSNFEAGLILKSKLVVFAEGTRGSLFKQVSQKLNLRKDKNPEVFEEGVKEVIQLPPGRVKPGQVIHTLGFPLKHSIGGTFLYTLPQDRVVLGLVAYLDSKDPLLDPHRELQKLKTHPWMAKFLEGGQVVSYGGKTLPAGGWYSMPTLAREGWMVCGDSASMVDVQKLKGIHLAMKSGQLAADAALQCLQQQRFDTSATQVYEKKVHSSFIREDLYRVRNFHQTLSKGLFGSLPLLAFQELTGGRGLVDPMPSHEDAKTTQKWVDVWGGPGLDHEDVQLPPPDGKLFYDKLSSVYLTGTQHDEDSPNHLILKNGNICRETCEPQYKSPCTHFCPAKVYEMLPAQNGKSDQFDLQINFTNCIHCKTCDIKCPFENIEWTVPEGGGGPNYRDT